MATRRIHGSFKSLISHCSKPPRTLVSQLHRLRPVITVTTTIPQFRYGGCCARFLHPPPQQQQTTTMRTIKTVHRKRRFCWTDAISSTGWLVVVEKPDENWTRDQIMDSYIKLVAQIVGSEEEARMKMYSVSTRHSEPLVSEELSFKIKQLPGVGWVLPDSYLAVRNKDHGGEPFIHGQAAPYDPKYHEEWIRNNTPGSNHHKRKTGPPRGNGNNFS
ncbi:OLC1v1017843C1 [Oldenlandia corymbosa var. corymbosa]|uniref:OLC1v1017843C1 n=1 Tax=Oldenlandia corymbosa var. corymbosa TaxID=529605 RepID=A0AAV1EAC5_OLDCO|nr:OLC1v1017843C1 [Oldenlandia corymbosa var. corymbosa]